MLTLDLTGALAINRGYDWAATLLYPGNVSLATFRGQIRESYAAESELAAFRFSAVYDAPTNQTRILMALYTSQTAEIPATDANFWIYDVKFSQLGKTPELILRGQIQVNSTLPL